MRVEYLAVVLAFSISVQAQVHHGRCSETGNVGHPLRGWVGYTNTGQDVAEMTVQVFQDKDHPPVDTTTTDRYGRFSFPNVRPGRYLLRAEAQEGGMIVDASDAVTVNKGGRGIACLVAEASSGSDGEELTPRIYQGIFLGCLSDSPCTRSHWFSVERIQPNCCVLSIRNGDGRGNDEMRSYQIFLNGEEVVLPMKSRSAEVEVSIAANNILRIVLKGEPFQRISVRIENKRTGERKRVPESLASEMLCHTSTPAPDPQFCGPIVAPAYPPLARAARIEGTVVLGLVIDSAGGVKEAKVISGHPMLSPAVVDAVQHWQYRPFVENGHPVEVETTVTVSFKLTQD